MPNKKKTSEDFIEKSRLLHGNFYDYSLVDYKGWDKEVKIICPKHGEFNQKCNVHLAAAGCPKCGLEKISQFRSKDTDWFIQRARAVHGDRYDYSKVDYKSNSEKVQINCPAHDISFFQSPASHFRGGRCPSCASVVSPSNLLKNFTSFLNRANEIYNNKYNYEHVIYKGRHTKVSVECPIHGIFSILPSSHLQGC